MVEQFVGQTFLRSDVDVIQEENTVSALVQTSYHFKVEICIPHSLSLFVHFLVMWYTIFNGPLQNYIINKPLAPLCFISPTLTPMYNHTTKISVMSASILFGQFFKYMENFAL